MQKIFDTIHAERTFKRADHRIIRIGRQILCTTFTKRMKLQHLFTPFLKSRLAALLKMFLYRLQIIVIGIGIFTRANFRQNV